MGILGIMYAFRTKWYTLNKIYTLRTRCTNIRNLFGVFLHLNLYCKVQHKMLEFEE